MASYNFKVKNNEALKLYLTLENVNLSGNTFYMEIRDPAGDLIETCTVTDSYSAPDTNIVCSLDKSEVELIPLGKYRYDVVMYSTFPTVILDGIVTFEQGVTDLP